MKILFVNNTLNMGGIETNLVRLTRGFRALGHDVLAATRGGRVESAFRAAGGDHHRVDISIGGLLQASNSLASLMMREQPDIVHAFSAPAALCVAVGKMRLRLSQRAIKRPPTVTSVMGLQNSPDERWWITRSRAWITCLGAEKVIVIAPAIAEVLAGVPVRRSRLVSLPVVGVQAPVEVDENERSRVRAEFGIAPGDQMVLTVGNLEPRKSHELFVRAAAPVARSRPNARFLIAGGGPLEQSLREEIERTGLGSQIMLLGERQDADALISAADLYIRPGVLEGFIGITVLEAQARGIPVVSFETTDVKLAIENGVTGRLVPRENVEAMTEAITELLDDGHLRRTLAEAGRQHVTVHHSIEAVVQGLEQLYHKLALAATHGWRS